MTKVSKSITTELDDAALRNLKIPKITKKRVSKMEAPDYGILTYGKDIPDYG